MLIKAEQTMTHDKMEIYWCHTPMCVVTCININAHIKNPAVHVRVWWIMETLKHPACTIIWEA